VIQDPKTYLWLYEQELGRTMKQNALERAARDAHKPAPRYRVSRLKDRIVLFGRALRPAGTGSA
jgi:hypothetical protein